MRALLVLALVLLSSQASLAETLRVAVAANFRMTLAELAPLYEAQSGDALAISVGSSGALTSQILQGAPFDVFLSADAAYPDRLIEAARAARDSRLVYAIGRLAVVSRPGAGDGPGALQTATRIALANPATAPYGRAAMQILDGLKAKGARIEARLVHARNVSGALAAFETQAVDAAFIASSMISEQADRSFWRPEPALYPALSQVAVAIEPQANSAAAARFLEFMSSAPARRVISAHGYGLD